jgi:hypothetical protein
MLTDNSMYNQCERARTFNSPRDGKVESVRERSISARYRDPVDKSRRPTTGQCRKIGGLRERLPDLVAGVRDDRLGERVRRRSLQAGQQPQEVLPEDRGRLRAWIYGRAVDHELSRLVQLEEVGDCRRSQRQRPRLVKHHHIDLGGGLGGLSGLDKNSELGANARPHLNGTEWRAHNSREAIQGGCTFRIDTTTSPAVYVP